jgi:hypothetical protein
VTGGTRDVIRTAPPPRSLDYARDDRSERLLLRLMSEGNRVSMLQPKRLTDARAKSR